MILPAEVLVVRSLAEVSEAFLRIAEMLRSLPGLLAVGRRTI